MAATKPPPSSPRCGAGPVPRKAQRRAFVVQLAATGLALGAMARTGAAEAPLRLGTSTPGGGFALYGETLATVLNRRAGRTVLRAVPTRGTDENLQRLASGELDAALIQGTAANQVLQGEGATRMPVLFAMYPSPGMLAVPADASARRLEDLRGQPVVFGVPSSGLVLLARQVFGALGMDIDRDFRAVYVEQAAQGPQRVLDGQAVGLWGAGEGWPGFVKLAQSPRGARFLAPAPAQIPRILDAQPFLKAMTMPAGTYAGLHEDLQTVGSWNLILARPDLPQATAQAFATALHEAAGDLGRALPQAAMSTAAATAEATPSPALLHPGTAQLLRALKLLPG
jgi:TRAP transporter TAXI family solute receptor